MVFLRHRRALVLFTFSVASLLVLVSAVRVAGAIDTRREATPTADIAQLVRECPETPGNHIPDLNSWTSDFVGGSDPLWVGGLGGMSEAELEKAFGTPIAFDTHYIGRHFAGPTEHGWFMRFIWLMPRAATEIVTVSGAERTSGASIYIDIVGRGPVTTAVFDAADPAISYQHGNWAEFPSGIYFPETGCYEITASWDGGSWTIHVPFVAPDGDLPSASPSPGS